MSGTPIALFTRWVALVAAVAVGARAASFWRDVNNANAALRGFGSRR